MYLYRILAVLALSLTTLSAHAVEKRSCGGDYKYLGQLAQGKKHSDVQRAGVVLLKDYGLDKNQHNDRYVVILGHDRHLGYWNFQAGSVEPHQQYTSETAAAELREETGGLIQYPVHHIRELPYLYNGQKQLFFLLDRQNINIGVRAISKACAAAVKDKHLPHSFREVDRATAVPVIELLRVARMIHEGKLGKLSTYPLRTRDGHTIHISGTYMRVIAYRYHHACMIFNQMFGVNIF